MFRLIWMMIVFLGVWLMASAINTLLTSIGLLLLPPQMERSIISINMVISLLILGPIHVLAGFVTFIAKEFSKDGFKIFQASLFVMLVSSIVAAALIINVDEQLGNAKYIMSISVVISSITAPLFFRQSIKNNA